MNFVLKRVDDGHRFTIESDGSAAPLPGDDQSAYEAGYRRIAPETEVAPDRARIFETGGNFVLVVRDGKDLFAFDGHPLLPPERTPHLVYSQRFVVEKDNGESIRTRVRPLAATVEDGWIWVDVEALTR